eukprot:434147_1
MTCHLLACILCFACSTVLSRKQYKYTTHYHDIIILGAGMSGVSAASKLHELGMDNFIIIEAQNHIGGRIKNINFAGYTLNAGASYIEGVCIDNTNISRCTKYKTNPIASLTQKYNISTTLTHDTPTKQFQKDSIILNSNGDKVSYSNIQPAFYKWKKAKQCANILLSHSKTLEEDKFYYMFFHYGHFWRHILLFIPLIIICGFIFLCCSFLVSNRPCFCCLVWTQIFILFYISGCIFWELYKYSDILFDDQPYSFLLEQCNWNKLSKLTSMEKLVQFLDFELQSGDSITNISMEYKDQTFQHFGTDSLFVNDDRGYHEIVLKMAEAFEHKIMLNHIVNRVEILRPNQKTQRVQIFTNRKEIYQCKYVIITFPIGVLKSKMVKFYPRLPAFKRESIMNYKMIDYTVIYVKWPYNFWKDKLEGKEKKYIILMDDSTGYYEYILNLNHREFVNGSLIWRFDVTANREATNVQYQKQKITVMHIRNKLMKYFDKVPKPLDIYVSRWRRNHFSRGSFASWPVGFSDHDIHKIKSVWYKNVYFIGSGLSIPYGGYVHGAFIEGQRIAQLLIKNRKLNVTNVNV